MLRKDIENYMKTHNKKYLVIVANQDDKLGMLCSLSSGYLVDCDGHRMDRKKDYWGYINYTNGRPERVAW